MKPEDKLAEEILKKHRAKDDALPHWITIKHAIEAMHEYHEAKMKEELMIQEETITNADIEAWAKKRVLIMEDHINYRIGKQDGLIEGARALRNGKIKHIENGDK